MVTINELIEALELLKSTKTVTVDGCEDFQFRIVGNNLNIIPSSSKNFK